MRYLKYVIISVFTILILSCFAFAADDPVVATVNGEGYSNIADALSVATAGDRVEVVKSVTIDYNITVPADVNFYVNPGVIISTSNNIINNGNSTIYGNIVREESSNSGYLFANTNGNVSFFGSVIDTSVQGALTVINGNADIYGGTFSAQRYAVAGNGGNVNIYNGEFTSVEFPNNPVAGSYVTYPSGVNHFIEGGKLIVSWGPLYQIGQIVTSAISWLGMFVTAIVTNKILLVFVIVIFVGCGIGLIKRIIY